VRTVKRPYAVFHFQDTCDISMKAPTAK